MLVVALRLPTQEECDHDGPTHRRSSRDHGTNGKAHASGRRSQVGWVPKKQTRKSRKPRVGARVCVCFARVCVLLEPLPSFVRPSTANREANLEGEDSLLFDEDEDETCGAY